MGSVKPTLLTDLQYSAWANQCLLAACKPLTVAEQTRDLGLSHHSVLETMQHIYLSERFWSDCLLADALPALEKIGMPAGPPNLHLEELQRAWPKVWSALEQWLASVPEEELTHTLPCRVSAESNFLFTRWQLLRHLVNHSTLHRGQVVSMLRMLGNTPPNVDLMSYLLQ
jgi:uncharacterized damage-inducible protein DinB